MKIKKKQAKSWHLWHLKMEKKSLQGKEEKHREYVLKMKKTLQLIFRPFLEHLYRHRGT